MAAADLRSASCHSFCLSQRIFPPGPGSAADSLEFDQAALISTLADDDLDDVDPDIDEAHDGRQLPRAGEFCLVAQRLGGGAGDGGLWDRAGRREAVARAATTGEGTMVAKSRSAVWK